MLPLPFFYNLWDYTCDNTYLVLGVGAVVIVVGACAYYFYSGVDTRGIAVPNIGGVSTSVSDPVVVLGFTGHTSWDILHLFWFILRGVSPCLGAFFSLSSNHPLNVPLPLGSGYFFGVNGGTEGVTVSHFNLPSADSLVSPSGAYHPVSLKSHSQACLETCVCHCYRVSAYEEMQG